MSKSTPKAPDYTAAAEAQAQSSREVTEQQTWANRPDQITPFGSQSWQNQQVWDPSTQQWLNRWAQVTELNPTLQTAADAQMQMTADRSQLAGSLTNRMQNEYGQAMDWSGFSPMAQTPQGQAFGLGQYSPESIQRNISNEGLTNLDPSQRYYQQAGDAIWNQWADRNLPLQQQDEARIRGQLYNSGLKEGDEAYNREMERLRQSQGDARQQAAYQATIGAGQEAQRMLGMDAGTRAQLFGERGTMGQFSNAAAQQALQQQLGIGGQQFQENLGYNNQLYNQQMQSAGYQNQLRQQQIAEAMQQRGFSLNEINAILSGQQVNMPSMPGFNTAQASQATNYLGAAQSQYQSALDAFNAQQAGLNSALSGAGSVGAFMMSDRRLKRNIRRIGSVKGVNLYSFEYIWGEKAVGVMADEVTHIPGAVAIHPSGFAMVDYGVIYG